MNKLQNTKLRQCIICKQIILDPDYFPIKEEYGLCYIHVAVIKTFEDYVRQMILDLERIYLEMYWSQNKK